MLMCRSGCSSGIGVSSGMSLPRSAGSRLVSQVMRDPLHELRSVVNDSVAALRDGDGDASPTLERPPRPELGDYSTNAAMLLAPSRGEPPRSVAEALSEELEGRLEGAAERIEVAGPGFINLFLADR